MIEKNTVILRLKDYLDLIKENESLKEEVKLLRKDNSDLSTERTKLRNLILEGVEHSTIYQFDGEFEFDLERIIDVEDWAFGIRDPEKLLKLGFTLEEMVDYIIERRKGYEDEK